MNDQLAVLDTFNDVENTVSANAVEVLEVFKLPTRNWNRIVDFYNSTNKRKFPFTPLQCKLLIEYSKKGIPPEYIFRTLGVSKIRYGNLRRGANELEAQLEVLATKETLSEDDWNDFYKLMHNPLRILMADIERAEGIADLKDWEFYNEYANTIPDYHVDKMKAKFKEFKQNQGEGGNFNVQINLGGDWISEL